MADELLHALGKRQRELDESDPPLMDAVEGDAGEALLDGLFEQLDAAPSKPAPESETTPATVTELPRRRSAVWATAAVVLAAAAALVLWFATRAPETLALPTYHVVAIAGGPASVRGDHDAVAKTLTLISPSDNVRLEFAAASPVGQSLTVSLLARPASGAPVFATASVAEISPSGSIRMQGPLDRFIALQPGTWTLEVIITPTEAAPASADDATEGDWQRFPIEVIIAAP